MRRKFILYTVSILLFFTTMFNISFYNYRFPSIIPIQLYNKYINSSLRYIWKEDITTGESNFKSGEKCTSPYTCSVNRSANSESSPNSNQVSATSMKTLLELKKSTTERQGLKMVEESSDKDVENKFVFPITPRDFLEIGKIYTNKPFQRPNQIFGLSGKFNPEYLRRRLKAMPNNSDTAKFVQSQNHSNSQRKAYCSTTFRKWQLSLRGERNLILHKNRSLLYCPIYKSASTTWITNLLKMSGVSVKKGDVIQRLVKEKLSKVNAFQASNIAKNLTLFMVVRHPINRIVSAYRDKFENASKHYYYRQYGIKMIRMFRNIPENILQDSTQMNRMMQIVEENIKKRKLTALPDNPFANPYGPTFNEFLRYITSTNHDDEHWAPYLSYCSLCLIDYDFTIRFENIHEDSWNFIEYLNLSSVIKTKLANPTNYGQTDDEMVCQYLKQIEAELFMKVIKKYYHDFYLFQYKPDKFLKCLSDFDMTSVTLSP